MRLQRNALVVLQLPEGNEPVRLPASQVCTCRYNISCLFLLSNGCTSSQDLSEPEDAGNPGTRGGMRLRLCPLLPCPGSS